MRVKQPEQRLKSLWGLIDRQHNGQIAAHVMGKRVLDVGCGYGSLVAFLQDRGFDVKGIDSDPDSIENARKLFPRAQVTLGHAEEMDVEKDGQFDSITLKDCLHHLVGDHHAEEAFVTFKRLLRPHGRLIVFDPNPNWILRSARKLASFEDFQTPIEEAVTLLHQQGFEVRLVRFYEMIGLPLSGGYVFVELVPRVRLLQVAVAEVNAVLSRLVSTLGLGKALCWRYMIVADLRDNAERQP